MYDVFRPQIYAETENRKYKPNHLRNGCLSDEYFLSIYKQTFDVL